MDFVAEGAYFLDQSRVGLVVLLDRGRALGCEKAMIAYLKANNADLMSKMESSADLDGESEKLLAAGIAAFKSSWA